MCLYQSCAAVVLYSLDNLTTLIWTHVVKGYFYWPVGIKSPLWNVWTNLAFLLQCYIMCCWTKQRNNEGLKVFGLCTNNLRSKHTYAHHHTITIACMYNLSATCRWRFQRFDSSMGWDLQKSFKNTCVKLNSMKKVFFTGWSVCTSAK